MKVLKNITHLLGNTVIDTLLYLKIKELPSKFLEDININEDFVLITCHKRENQENNLDSILKAIKILPN